MSPMINADITKRIKNVGAFHIQFTPRQTCIRSVNHEDDGYKEHTVGEYKLNTESILHSVTYYS